MSKELSGVKPVEVEAAEVESNLTPGYDAINKEPEKKSLSDIIGTLPVETDAEYGLLDPTQRTSEQRAKDFELESKQAIVPGLNFNFEYTDGTAYLDDDYRELQAERQPGWDKFKRGTARLVGEFVLNVLETPGMVIGGGAAVATQDINQMTDNFWVNTTEELKKKLAEYNPVYTRNKVREGGVWDKMTSGEWITTEGVSALAFMGAALVPGAAVTKLGKAMSLTRSMAKGGKWARGAMKSIDDFATKTGLGAGEASKIGAGAGNVGNLINSTLINTTYEAGVEAKGAQQAFEAEIQQQYTSGKIDYTEYLNRMEESAGVAADVFRANAAILVGPNMVMNKMLLGPRGNTLNSLKKNMHVGKAGRFIKGAQPLKDAQGIKGALQSGGARMIGKNIKGFGTNTLREGVWEEGMQSTATEYYATEYAKALESGEDKRNWLRTYGKVLGSTDGQIAALTAGIISAPLSIRSRMLQSKSLEKQSDEAIDKYNNSLNYYKAARENMYQKDQDGNIVYKQEVQPDGTTVSKPVVDSERVKQLADSKEQVDKLQFGMNTHLMNGETELAAGVAARLQAQAFAPFIENGVEGIEMLKEALLQSPSVAMTVDAMNKENNTKVSYEDYVAEEVQKAEAQLETYNYFTKKIGSPTSYGWNKTNLKGLTAEAQGSVAALRDQFNNSSRDNYVEATAVADELMKQHATLSDTLTEAKARKASAEEITNINRKLDDINSAIVKSADVVSELGSQKNYEESWDTYIKDYLSSSRINSGDVTDYLDSIIDEIKKATDTDELQKVIDKAAEEGVILANVEYDKLPPALIAMAKGDDFVAAYGAIAVIAEHGDTKAKEAVAAGNKNLNVLVQRMNEVLEYAVGEVTKFSKDYQTAQVEKINNYREQLGKLNEKLESIDQQIADSYRTKNQFKTASVFNKTVKALIKTRDDAIKLEKEVAADLETAINQFKTYRDSLYIHALVIKNMRKNAPNKGMANLWDDFFEKAGIKKKIDEYNYSGEFGNKLFLSLEEVLSAFEERKESFLLNNSGTITASAFTLSELKNRVDELKRLQSNIQKYIKKTNQLIKKLSKIKSPEDKKVALSMAEEQLVELTDQLAEIENTIQEISDVADKADQRLSGFMVSLDAGIQAIKDKLLGNTVSTVANTPEAAISKINKAVKTHNLISMATNASFEDGYMALRLFASQLKFVEEYIAYVEAARLADVDTIQEYNEYVTEQIKKGVKPTAPKTSDTKDKKDDTEPTGTNLAHISPWMDGQRLPSLKEGTHIDPKNNNAAVIEIIYSNNPARISALLDFILTQVNKGDVSPAVLSRLDLLYYKFPKLGDLLQGLYIDKPYIPTEASLREAKKVFEKAIVSTITSSDNSGSSSTTPTGPAPTGPAPTGPAPTGPAPAGSSSTKPGPQQSFKEVIAIVNDKDIQQAVNDIIKAQHDKISEEKLALKIKEFNQMLHDKEARWAGIIHNKEYIAEGNTVTWGNNRGTVLSLVKDGNKSTNVLVRDTLGKLHFISASGLTKANLTISEENSSSAKKHKNKEDKEKTPTLGKTTYTKFSIRSDDHKKLTKKDPKTTKYIKINNTARIYFEEPRDKTKDKVSFAVGKSTLQSKNNGLNTQHKALKEGPEKEELAKRINTLEIVQGLYNDIMSGDVYNMHPKDMQLFMDFMPLRYRVTRSDGKPGGAEGEISSKDETTKNFNAIEGQLRAKIFNTFFTNIVNGKSPTFSKQSPGVISGELAGITGNFKFVYTGVLNKESGTENKLTDLKGIEINKMEMFTVDSMESGKIIPKNGVERVAPPDVIGKVGGVFVVVKDNNGKKFNLRANVATLENSGEIDIVMSLLRGLMNGKLGIKNTITPSIQSELATKVPLLSKVFDQKAFKNPTAGDLLSTILMRGNKHSQLYYNFNAGNKQLTIGDTVYNILDFNKFENAIKADLSLKLRNISFKTTVKGIPTMDNKLYLSYIIDSKSLTTDVKANENIFIGSKDDTGANISNINGYMSENEIKFAKPVSTGDIKKVKQTKPTGPVTSATQQQLAAIMRPLQKAIGSRIDVGQLTKQPEVVDLLFKIYIEAGTKINDKAVNAYNQAMKAVNDTTGDTKIKDEC